MVEHLIVRHSDVFSVSSNTRAWDKIRYQIVKCKQPWCGNPRTPLGLTFKGMQATGHTYHTEND